MSTASRPATLTTAPRPGTAPRPATLTTAPRPGTATRPATRTTAPRPGAAPRPATRARTLTAAAALLATAACAAAATPASAAAKPKKAKKTASTKPVLKIDGISVNRWYMRPGNKAKANDDTNACYTMLGAAGTPDSFQAFPFVHAVNVPKDAPTTVVFHTPWDAKTTPENITATGKFGDVLFKTTTNDLAGAFGGPVGPKDFYRYSMLPTGVPASYNTNGDYSVTVTATVKRKPLTASATVSVAC